MLDRAERAYVEAIKRAKMVSIVINEGRGDELTLTCRQDVRNIRKLSHDIALAFQEYFNVRRP